MLHENRTFRNNLFFEKEEEEMIIIKILSKIK